MTPAEQLADEITLGIVRMMEEMGFTGNPAVLVKLQKELAAKIQQVADDQQQSDAQAFGDEMQVTVQGIEQCDCMLPADGVTVTITPLFPTPNGLN